MNPIIYQDITEVQTKGNKVKSIGYKPVFATIVIAILAICLIATLNWAAIVLGAFILIIDIVTIICVKDRTVMDIYDQGVLLYDSDDNSKAYFIDYDDVQRWTAKKNNGANEAIYFKLNDGTEIYKNTFQSSKAFRQLNLLIGDKEELAIKSKNLQVSIKNPFKDWFKKKDK